MWLWILSALFILLVWAVYFVAFNGLADTPGLPMWVPIAISAAVVLGLIGLVVYRRVRAARAARALEKAIAEQAQEQALAAKPERRAEIQELHRQIQEGINALKTSKLGGGKRGADALYALPWYVIVGPPGAGKTTALRHSGLVFPYLDPAGGGVRGVGGATATGGSRTTRSSSTQRAATPPRTTTTTSGSRSSSSSRSTAPTSP